MPDIVYVDDAPGELIEQASSEQSARINSFVFEDGVVSPDAFSAARTALVWLFDFYLVDQRANEQRDENGLSLVQKWRAALGAGQPTTVVVSNHLQDVIAEAVGRIERRHVVAQRHGVEWIDEKTPDALRRIVVLADATKSIAASFEGIDLVANETVGSFDAERLGFDVLGVPENVEWANSAQRQIDRARPPRVVPLAKGPAAGRSVTAWMLAHVLPYPSFLLSDAQAALRLGVTPKSFRGAADSQGKATLDPLRYAGPLCDFHGRRWWRAAIDDFAWQHSQGDVDYREALRTALGCSTLTWLEQSAPVLLSDDDLIETDDVADASECVRVVDEDFPANVEPAWVRIQQAKDNRKLISKVVYEDRPLLDRDQ